jgi:hypothetical protein
LVLPYRVRILGLFAPESDRNLFWMHPALNAADTAHDFYQSSEWHNSGGDRTWLSPEIDFFFPHCLDLDTYWQPREFDPGHYQVTHENGALTLTDRFQAQPSHSRYIAKVEESKRLAFARNPFCQFEWADTLSYAGYSLSARPSFTSSEVSPFPIGFMELASTSSRRRSSGSHLFHVAANDIHGADRSIRPDSHGASGAL